MEHEHAGDAGSGWYRIVLAGRAGDRTLRPFEDDFEIRTEAGQTVLRGRVRDAAHLHGVVTHLTAMGVRLVALGPDGEP